MTEPPLVRPEGVRTDCIVRTLRVPEELAGMRLDRYLMTQLRSTSRTRARVIIEHSAFTPDGRRHRASDRVRGDQWIVLWRPPFEDEEADDARLPIGTIYEDEHVWVVDKPAPMTVHPSARYYQHTLIKRLEAERPGAYLSLIHRIDRDTSGLLLVAKTREADRTFKRILEDRSVAVMAQTAGRELDAGMLASARRGSALSVGKRYLAITWGHPAAGLIDVPLEPDLDNPLRVKMRVAKRGGLDARTEVIVLDRCDGYALVACELHTGRQHQIRLHLAHGGTPIVGDKLYGPDDRLLARASDGDLTDADRALLELPRHALHAHRYELPHPLTGERLVLCSPLPTDLVEFWCARAGRVPFVAGP